MHPDPSPATDTARLRSRNDGIVRGALAAYLILFAAFALSNGVQLTPDVLLVGFALVTTLIGWRLAGAGGLHPIRDWLPFVLLALAYELIRAFGPVLLRNVNVDVGAAIDRALLGGAIASDVLQRFLRPSGWFDALAVAATAIYAFHVLLPIVVALYLWSCHRAVFYDFVAGLVLLSLAAFATYLLLPVAPPWWAAAFGHLPATAGQPLLGHLQGGAFDSLAAALGLTGGWVASLAFGDVSPDPVAAFPSLHAAYPILAYLCLRRVAGPAKWLALAYTAAAWFSIIYLGDHYLIDIAGGVVYAGAAWHFVAHSSPIPVRARPPGPPASVKAASRSARPL